MVVVLRKDDNTPFFPKKLSTYNHKRPKHIFHKKSKKS